MKNFLYVLFIGMGDWDTPQLEIAHKLGYKTIVTNKNVQSQALPLADVGFVVDGTNVNQILGMLYEENLEEKNRLCVYGDRVVFMCCFDC
jgi:hypothetical protein